MQNWNTCTKKDLKIKLKLTPTPLSMSEVTEAERRIVNFVQRQLFPIDIDSHDLNRLNKKEYDARC